METDSLYKRRVQQVVKQPDTWRGKTIEWYATQENTPWRRVLLITGLTLLMMMHTLAFTIMLRYYIDGVSLRIIKDFRRNYKEVSTLSPFR